MWIFFGTRVDACLIRLRAVWSFGPLRIVERIACLALTRMPVVQAFLASSGSSSRGKASITENLNGETLPRCSPTGTQFNVMSNPLQVLQPLNPFQTPNDDLDPNSTFQLVNLISKTLDKRVFVWIPFIGYHNIP